MSPAEPRVSALFVRSDGLYPRLVADWWDAERDATAYQGPNPIVAHPPCQRWGRFWWADGSTEPGDDGGLFQSALDSLRAHGGVLEHPEGSHAWRRFDLPTPTPGAWVRSLCGLWTTCVAQRQYGHPAVKKTFLLYKGDAAPPTLDWTIPDAAGVYLAQPGRCKKGKPRKRCPCQRCAGIFGEAWEGGDRVFKRITAAENELTPEPFARLLISMASRSLNRPKS